MGFVGAREDVDLAHSGLEVLGEALVDDLRGLANELDLDPRVPGDERVPHGIGRSLRVVRAPPDDFAFLLRRLVQRVLRRRRGGWLLIRGGRGTGRTATTI